MNSTHKPRILIQYGSLRATSYSRKLAETSKEILESFGAEVRIYDPRPLPIYDQDLQDDPAVVSYLEQVDWAEGFVWISPELHGNMAGVMKNQIDWIPLKMGASRPTQGKTLAVMQVSGGSQSFNVVNNLRVLGRWMRMFTIPNQSSVAKAYQEFNEDGTMKSDSPFLPRVIDVCEELVKFTTLLRDQVDHLTDRYSERMESSEELIARVNLERAV